MNKQSIIISTIVNEIKRSFESPVILITMKDYANCIFYSLVEMRKTLLEQADADPIGYIINTFHLQWLQAVQDVEFLKMRGNTIPRDVIYKAIEYTKKCGENRVKYYQQYVQELQIELTEEEMRLREHDLHILEEMCKALNSVLEDKQKCLSSLADQTEFCIKLIDEIEELMIWLDNLNDHLAIEFSKLIGIKSPQFVNNLAKTLNVIIDGVAVSSNVDVRSIAKEITYKRLSSGCIDHLNTAYEIEITNLQEKVNILQKQITQQKFEKYSAATALQHKTIYLQEKLQSLQNLKMSLITLKNRQIPDYQPGILESIQENLEYRIFDHLLPAHDRYRLVEHLVKQWDNALRGSVQEQNSIISILCVADINETFSDKKGKYTVDKHGRKLYKIDCDDNCYQLNEINQLVAIDDDDRHVYFYDACGRYFLNEEQQRVYKTHSAASEYVLNLDGELLKIKDADLDYWYDDLGRYYKDNCGNKIYCETNSDDKYENDGVDNLVRIPRGICALYQPCPLEPLVTDESKYLKRAVGTALRQCLAKVVVHQPVDPILYLADSLEKYRLGTEARQQRLQDEQEMMIERQRRIETQQVSSNTSCNDISGEEPHLNDLINYQCTL